MNKKVSSVTTTTAGGDVKLNHFSENSIKCPEKYINAIKSSSERSASFADKTELKYFKAFVDQVKSDKGQGWNLLTTQEKKVILGLREYKIPAYIGYRKSFGAGLERDNYKDKPIFILLEVSSACNIKCQFCFQSDPTFTTKDFMGLIDTKLAYKVIDEMDKMKIRGITIASRGEPLLCRDLDKILDRITQKENILEVKLNTNAKRLTEETLKKLVDSPLNILVVSTDHYEKELYEKYRHGAKFDNFIKNISRINDVRRSFGRTNTLYTRASGVGVDKTMQLEKYDEFYLDYFDESGTVTMSERWDTYNNKILATDTRPCGLPFERLYIWFDGVTNPCDADYKSYLSPGNIKDSSLSECWNRMAKLREDMLSGDRQKHTPCDRCYLA